MAMILRLACVVAIAISAISIFTALTDWNSPAHTLRESYREVFDAQSDPALPFTVLMPRSDVFGKPYVKGPAVMVLCGPCAACSIRTYDAAGVAKSLAGHANLILVYESDAANIKRQYAKQRRPENVFVLADAGMLGNALNGGFPYRHARGTVQDSRFLATKLQKYGESETEILK